MKIGTRNRLTGQIGEHLVSAILGTLGYYASPYAGNVPEFDLTAVNSQSLESFPVQVKTSNGGALVRSTIDKWIEHRIGKDKIHHIGEPFQISNPNMIWIIVQLTNNDIKTARFFVCTKRQVQEKIVSNFTFFMKKHEWQRPLHSSSKTVMLTVKELEEYEDNWSILGEKECAKQAT